ncbi:MAG: VWA domain-containing protein [Candidatus Acidiferrales bacterium]
MRFKEIGATGALAAVALAGLYFTAGAAAQPAASRAKSAVAGQDTRTSAARGIAPQEAQTRETHSKKGRGGPNSLRSETRLITVDVSVRDAHGNPVRGLKPSDFRIFDDGHGPQQIAGFEFIEPSASPGPQAAGANATVRPAKAAPRPDPVYSNQRYVKLPVPPTAILLDPGTIAFQDQVTARLQVLKLLDKLPARTPVAIFLLAHGLIVVQNFTTDRTALRTAVNRSMIPMQKVKNPENDPQNTFTSTNTGAKASQAFQKLEYEEQTTVIADETSDAMRAIAKDLSGYPGRKNLVWISEAFPQWILPGSGFGAHSVEAGDSSSLSNPFRQDFSGSASYGDKLQSDAQALVDARVTVYPVDARGLVAPSLYDASGNMLATDPSFASNPGSIGPAMGAELTRENTDLTFSQGTMEEIAQDTGGTACKNTNDLSGCAKTAIEDGSPDYEISYYPAGVKWDGSFHRITLKTDLHGVRIHYRRGYSAVDTTELAKERPMEFFREACASLLPATSIELRAEALRASRAGESRYLLSVSPSALNVTPAGGKLALHLRLAVCEFAPQGGRFRIYTRNLTRTFPERDAEKWQKQDVQSVIDYKSKPETRRLRLAVLDTSTGLTGSVDVPAHPRVVFEIEGLDPEAEKPGTNGPANLYSRLQFHSSNGDSGGLDLSGDRIEYRGKLGIDLAVPAFFHRAYGGDFHCDAGKLVANEGHSGEPSFRFAFKNSAGLLALVDLAGQRPSYAGALPVDASARAFFDRLWKLCHCEQP